MVLNWHLVKLLRQLKGILKLNVSSLIKMLMMSTWSFLPLVSVLTQLLVLVSWKHSVMALTLLIRNKKHQLRMFTPLVTVLPFMTMPLMMSTTLPWLQMPFVQVSLVVIMPVVAMSNQMVFKDQMVFQSMA